MEVSILDYTFTLKHFFSNDKISVGFSNQSTKHFIYLFLTLVMYCHLTGVTIIHVKTDQNRKGTWINKQMFI